LARRCRQDSVIDGDYIRKLTMNDQYFNGQIYQCLRVDVGPPGCWISLLSPDDLSARQGHTDLGDEDMSVLFILWRSNDPKIFLSARMDGEGHIKPVIEYNVDSILFSQHDLSSTKI
jgi:hypothetical protein